MPRTNLFSAPDSTADSWSADQSPVQAAGRPKPGGLCAIHQPNLFPRLSTLAKLFTADYWIVLDDVQFTRRDYQHRARLADLDDAGQRRWLSISTHLPHGRSTTVGQALIVEPGRCRRRTAGMIGQHYRSSPHWPALRDPLDAVLGLFDVTDRTAAISEASTRALLDVLGWNGEVLRSSRLPARPGRSQRLADLAAATGARAYLCGTGGMRYLDPVPFLAAGIAVTPFRTPAGGIWRTGREISALWALMTLGPLALAEHLRGL